MRSLYPPEEQPLRELLHTFTYKPGWTFHIKAGHLIIRTIVIDTDNPEQTIQVDFGVGLPSYVRDDFDWTHWLFHHIMTVEDHEAREFFKINGVKVYDPHA